MVRLTVFVLVILQLTALAMAETKTTTSKDGKFRIDESLIYEEKIGGSLIGRRASPDNRRIAVMVQKDGKEAIWTEEYGLSSYYDKAWGVYYSGDSKRLAWSGMNVDGSTSVFVDGEFIGNYDLIVHNELLFTDDNKSFVFIKAKKATDPENGQLSFVDPVVVVNGVEHEQYPHLYPLNPEEPEQTLCIEDSLIIYFAGDGEKQFIVVNGQRGPLFDLTGSGPVISDNAEHIAYACRRDSLWYIVVDTTLYGPYPKITYISFANASTEPAYIVQWPDSSRIFINHEMQATEYKWVRDPLFSNSVELLCYWASDGKKVSIVNPNGYDACSDHDYYSVSTPWYDANETHYVYEMVFDSDFKKRAFVVDGTLLKAADCSGTSNINFSNDGEHFATRCVSESPLATSVMIDNEMGPFEGTWIDEVTFSDNGERWATRVVGSKTLYLLIDGQRHDVKPMCSSVHFSPNGKHLAYTIGNKDRSKEYVMIDNTRFKEYAEINGDKLEFSPDGTLTFYGREKFSKFYRVKVTPLNE